jgi:endoglucanase Acf2
MGKNQAEDISLSARARPQYHYFYGSTDTRADANQEQEQESLIGEELVSTDHEGETPTNSDHDLQHLVITNGNHTKKGGFFVRPSDRSSSNGVARMIVIIALVGAMSLLLVVFLFPHTSDSLPLAAAFSVPFPAVNRADYGDPVERFIDLDLFHPSLLSESEPRTFNFPFPTGAFWTNFIVPSPDKDYSYPVAVYPYAYKWSDETLQLSYPASHRFTDKQSIRDTVAPDLTFSSKEVIQARYVTKFDPLSVSLRFVSTSESQWESILVQGSPYATLKYMNATPVIRALSIFKSVQCPGDDDENFSDLIDGDGRRQLFGVCSVDVSSFCP